MGGKLSKYQKFEVEVISRGEIHGADYNPRVISEDARKRLKRMLAKHGLVQPLVWNRRTGNLVSGHQRLSQLDQLERSQDYDLQVSVVDVDEREEKILNVQLNNPSMQGDWDMDKLNGLAGENGIDPEEFGFSSGDISVMFDSDMGGAFSDTEEVAEAKDTLREIKEHRAESTENMKREASGLPHARGGVSRPMSQAVFPTHVGVFPGSCTSGRRTSRLPHARGGVSPSKRISKMVHTVFPTHVGVFLTGYRILPGMAESSPRTWGCF